MHNQSMILFQNSSEHLLLDVGEDRLFLHGGEADYKLDVDLPYDVDPENVGAQFHKKTKVSFLKLKPKQSL